MRRLSWLLALATFSSCAPSPVLEAAQRDSETTGGETTTTTTTTTTVGPPPSFLTCLNWLRLAYSFSSLLLGPFKSSASNFRAP